jgi:hypothetical protein
MYQNPYAYRKPSAPKKTMSYTADNVWAAAWQAFVKNGKQYIKSFDCSVDPKATGQKTNRMIAEELLKDNSQLTNESREQGAIMRRYFQGLTFNLIEGKQLSPFMQSAFEVSNKDEIFNNFDLAVIVSLPATYVKATERDAIERKIKWAQGGLIGEVGIKTQQHVKVMKRVWSKKYNVWYYTGLTKEEQALFFAHKGDLEIDSYVTIEGKVKAHRDNSTQLGRVKVIK